MVIAILPYENTNKLLAKWKGPFVIIRINNRFQIEYLEGKAKRLTHISYAKKFHEQCNYFGLGRVASPGQSLANHWKDGTHSVELRLKKAQLPSAGSIPTRGSEAK